MTQGADGELAALKPRQFGGCDKLKEIRRLVEAKGILGTIQDL